jgi:hypothetical protein
VRYIVDSTSFAPHQDGNGLCMSSERMQHESRIGDQRPRERRRNRATGVLLAGGAVSGAVLFAVVVLIVRLIHGSGYSPLVYVVAAVVGGAIGLAILPYISLERADGADADAVRRRGRRGRADAPVEGAEATDAGARLHPPDQTR